MLIVAIYSILLRTVVGKVKSFRFLFKVSRSSKMTDGTKDNKHLDFIFQEQKSMNYIPTLRICYPSTTYISLLNYLVKNMPIDSERKTYDWIKPFEK